MKGPAGYALGPDRNALTSRLRAFVPGSLGSGLAPASSTLMSLTPGRVPAPARVSMRSSIVIV